MDAHSPDGSKEFPAPLEPLFAAEHSLPTQTPSIFYQVGLALVAGTMVLLPLVYVAFTCLAAYGVYYFATHHFVAIWEWPVSGRGGGS